LYRSDSEFKEFLQNNIEVMAKLSGNSEPAAYVLKIMKDGFDLLDEYTFNLQFDDFLKFLNKLGIKGNDEIDFIFSIVPRINFAEVITKHQQQN
jgi:hypothetical protein